MKTTIAKNNLTAAAGEHPLHKDVTVISVRGFIDTTTAPEFERTFQMVLGQKKFNIIINLKDVTYVSSAGWGIFVGEIKRIRVQKGNLFLVAMTPEVTDAYELLQFGTIIKSFPTELEALNKGFGKPKAKGAPGKAVVQVLEPAPVGQSQGSSSESVVSAAPTPAAPKKRSMFHVFLPWRWF